MRSYILTDREIGELLCYLDRQPGHRTATPIVRNIKSLGRRNYAHLRNQLKLIRQLLEEEGLCPKDVFEMVKGNTLTCLWCDLQDRSVNPAACTWDGWPE